MNEQDRALLNALADLVAHLDSATSAAKTAIALLQEQAEARKS